MAADPVLLLGIPSEPPLEMAAVALSRLGAPYVMLNQRECASVHLAFEVVAGEVTGVLESGGEALPLEGFGGVYTRLMDHRLLPELERAAADDPLVRHADRLHETMSAWYEIFPGRVVNRSRAMASNASKPYQAQIISAYFSIPRTLVTNDPEEALAFRAERGRVVYKSISGARSIVQELTGEDMDRLDRLQWCPVQFQELVEGTDVRVHTIADGRVFATAVASDAVDYRYAHRLTDRQASLSPYPIPDEMAESCLLLAAALGIDFAGIDLRITGAGEVYCFEVNPSPAYSYYEAATGQPISAALACYLAGASCS